VTASRLVVAAPGTESSSELSRQARLALGLFVVVLAGAFPLLLALGSYRWFNVDDLGYLAQRDPGDIGSLLRPSNEHWMTLPTLAYQGLWRLFGIRTYAPYQALVVTLHLTTAALLRTVMRRAGVGPWIATAVAVVFVLFGTGYDNMVRADTLGFNGSLVFGLVHLLLADHDGPLDHRDWLGLCAGAAGLLCSGVAVTMTIVVGIAVLLRRRSWRVALLHTAPLGLLFAVWWFTIARNDPWVRASRSPASTPGDLLRFVATGVGAALDGIGQVRGVGLAIAVVVGIGFALLWFSRLCTDRREQAAASTAMLIGAFGFLVITGLGRAGSTTGPDSARTSRYIYVTVALALPAMALAGDVVARRWRWAAPLVVFLLIVGIPGNVQSFFDARDRESATHQQMRTRVLSLPRVPAAKHVPGWVHPDWGGPAWPITMGWLRNGVASGLVPDPGPINPDTEAELNRQLEIQTYRQRIGRAARGKQR
jgi:hypothetical protein